MNNKALYKRIEKIINQKNKIFLTLTFNNKYLNKTNTKTRERYIKNFLNNQAENYILNCDFGTKNGREHYHAILNPLDKINGINLNAYKYGQIYGEFIRDYHKDKNKLINDLMNHCLKDTTNKSRLIYSRKHKKERQSAENENIFIEINLNETQYNKFNSIKKELSKNQLFKLSNSQTIKKIINNYKTNSIKNIKIEIKENQIYLNKDKQKFFKTILIKINKNDYKKLNSILNTIKNYFNDFNESQLIQHLINNYELLNTI